MSITPAAASAIQQSQIGGRIATAVMSKSFDVAKDQGEAMVSLLEEASELQREIAVDGQPHKGRHLDVRA